MQYATGQAYTLHQGDSRIVLKELADKSVDSVVTDPPYELGFMGKSWDASGVACDVELWREVLRVLKPGGHLLAFSGSRTYHRMAVAIEDAGFEIRDQIMWIYGSGFPKSLDVQKSIEKSDEYGFRSIKKTWQGWGTALKPAHEPIVLARKPLIGTVAENVLTYGTGGLNIDGGRVQYVDENDGGDWNRFTGYQPSSGDFQKVSINKDKENEKQRVDNGKQVGRWPANVIHDGSDEVVELFPANVKGQVGMKKTVGDFRFISGDIQTVQSFETGTFDSGSAARFFYCAKASKEDRNEGLDGFEEKRDHDGRNEGGVDGSNPRNRTNNYRQNHHPTVKPTTLMEYLCKLVTPPNGIVLDPFMGSGSTGKAAMYAGFNFIGIEMTEEYLPIAKARIEFALAKKEEFLL